jgi:predicted XRE-type DNA-binding protein
MASRPRTLKPKFTVGSDNIFKDAGIPDPEVALAKSKLILQIDSIIERHGLTQEEAAKILGTNQPTVSALLRGRLSSFSFDLLFKYLNKLNQSVEISTKSQDRHASVAVHENRISR